MIDEPRGDRSEFNPDVTEENSVEVILRQGHGLKRIARVKAEMGDATLWGSGLFEAFMAEVGLECRRGLGK